MAFELRIPTGKGGGKGGGNGGGSKETNKLLKKLDKSIIATFDPLEILTSAFKDLIQLFQPLIKILSILFLVIFLPLLPLLMLLTKGLALLVKLLTGGFGGIASFIGKIILGILLATLAFFLAPLAAGAAGIAVVIFLVVAAISLFAGAIWDVIKWIGTWIVDAGKFLGDALISLIQIIVNSAIWIWEAIQSGFRFILGIGKKIWGFFLDGLSFIADLGKKIWDFIWEALKGVGKLLTDGFKTIINAIISAINILPGVNIPKLANGGIVTSPTLALIGEAGPEAVIPLSKMGSMGTTININNPTIRSEADIRKMTDSISRALQRKGNRGFSSI